MDVSRVLLRRDLLLSAVEIARPIEECIGADPVLEIAEQLYAWCLRPMQIRPLTFGFVIERAIGRRINPFHTHPGTNPFRGEPTMANLQLGDSQQVTATAVPLDADGEPTADTLTWTASNTTAVGLTPSADTLSVVIDGLIPTAGVVITATDSLGNTSSGELDVVAGPAASLSISFGPVTDRAPATPAPTDGGTAPTDGAPAPTDGTTPDGGAPAPATPDAGTASA